MGSPPDIRPPVRGDTVSDMSSNLQVETPVAAPGPGGNRLARRVGWGVVTFLSLGVAGYAIAVIATNFAILPSSVSANQFPSSVGLRTHIVASALALLIGPFQFLRALRKRFPVVHRWLGRTTTRDTPVALDRRFVDADLRIVTGLVEPHYMAGWSGGRKVIAPGVAHHTTIRTFHSARFMEDPAAVQCRLEGNPLHEEQLEIVRMLGAVYALNTVVDEDRRLVHVSFGEVAASHRVTVDHVAQAIQVPVGRRFATVVTSAAGYPLDKTYYQTVKSMVTPLDILEPGGTLIVASECSEGFGSHEFREAQAKLVELGPERFLATLTAKSLAEIDEWQTEMQLKPMRRGTIQLFTTGLDAEERRITGVELVGSLDQAVADSVRRHGDDAVAIIPEGPYVVPVHGPAA